MIYSSENNWYYWTYDHSINGRRDLLLEQTVETFYSRYFGPVKTFKEELELTASSTLDHYPGLKPSVFFSGGIDSELMLRAYQSIGSNPTAYIVRYENDINLYDVSYAVAICNSLNVSYKIIDFNLQRFFENDAVSIADKAQIDRPRMLPHLKFTADVDGLVIVGHSDIAWIRPSSDYNVETEWIARDFEHDLGCDKYNMLINRPAVYQWWKWRPALVLSYMQLEWFKALTANKIPGKLGINSSKILGFREVHPDMLWRQKQTGFEFIPEIIEEVERTLEAHFSGLPFRQQIDRTKHQLLLEMLGNYNAVDFYTT